MVLDHLLAEPALLGGPGQQILVKTLDAEILGYFLTDFTPRGTELSSDRNHSIHIDTSLLFRV